MDQQSKILVPIDLSACSRQVLHHARHVASITDASIHVLHVWGVHFKMPPDVWVTTDDDIGSSLLRVAQNQARQELDRLLCAEAASTEPKPLGLLRWGEPATEIISAANEGRYDLIVMGTHGRRGLLRVLLGSVAERVVREAPCPVLTVRSDASRHRAA